MFAEIHTLMGVSDRGTLVRDSSLDESEAVQTTKQRRERDFVSAVGERHTYVYFELGGGSGVCSGHQRAAHFFLFFELRLRFVSQALRTQASA